MTKSHCLPVVCLVFLGLAAGCSKATIPKPVPLTEAHQKFLKICREEQKLNIFLHPLQQTLWIYLPQRENLVGLVATSEGPQKSETFKEQPVVKYLDSAYANRRFLITYDIRPDKNYTQAPGTKLDYLPLYHKISRQIMTAISQNYLDTADAPSFFVTIIFDILNGIEIENILYLDDLKWVMSAGSMPQEEFIKRILYEIRGKKEWIGDSEGQHLAYNEITMPEFLARQIAKRINFKYQQSSFPPSNDVRREILTIVAETIKNYNFTDFNYIELRDLNGTNETVLPSELQQLP